MAIITIKIARPKIYFTDLQISFVNRIGFEPMAYSLACRYSFHYIKLLPYFVVWTVSSPYSFQNLGV